MTTATTQSGWVELVDQCVLSFHGSAARDFLSRQLTCDVSALSPLKAQFGAWLSPKGRVLALLRLIDRSPNHIDAVVPAVLADELMRRLRMSVLRDDVTIGVDSELGVIGAWGDCAVPAHEGGSGLASLRSATTVVLSAQPPLAMLCAATSELQSAFGEQPEHLRGSAQQWLRLCIEAGLPQVGSLTREAFIPQMLNLDRLGAVSFTKGCYPGQEIVARTQHLGRIKRRMYIARVAHGDEPANIQPGDVIVGEAGEDIGGRVVCVDCAPHDSVLLAVLPVDADSSPNKVRLHDASGALLDVVAPPYSLSDPPA